jgi:hypothetical protein
MSTNTDHYDRDIQELKADLRLAMAYAHEYTRRGKDEGAYYIAIPLIWECLERALEYTKQADDSWQADALLESSLAPDGTDFRGLLSGSERGDWRAERRALE